MHFLALAIFLALVSSPIMGQKANRALVITQLTGDFYVYTTFNEYKGSRIPANGTYLVTTAGVALFDTPWDTTQFQPLLDSIQMKHHQPVVLCLATHFHEDRTGGLEYYRRKKIKTYTTRQTDGLSKSSGKKQAEFLISSDTLFTLGQYSFQTYYPGHGHTVDNIVIWFEKDRILHGGCLIKSTEDHDLGNLADADIMQYAPTVKNVIQKCNNPKFVIPGHNQWNSTESLNHTFQMAQALMKKVTEKK